MLGFVHPREHVARDFLARAFRICRLCRTWSGPPLAGSPGRSQPLARTCSGRAFWPARSPLVEPGKVVCHHSLETETLQYRMSSGPTVPSRYCRIIEIVEEGRRHRLGIGRGNQPARHSDPLQPSSGLPPTRVATRPVARTPWPRGSCSKSLPQARSAKQLETRRVFPEHPHVLPAATRVGAFPARVHGTLSTRALSWSVADDDQPHSSQRPWPRLIARTKASASVT